MTTQYNVVTYGNLTNTNGVLSNFSASNYATIPLTFNPVQHPYEMVFKVNTETMPTDAGGIIWQTGDVLTSRGRLDLEVSENKLYAEYAANGALVWNIDGITTLSSDTDYWVKLTYNGVNTYGLYLSTNGTTWTTEGTATSSGFLGDGTAEYNIIGVQPDEGGMIAPWFGSIDLNESYIDINNIRWWQGVTSTSNVRTRIQLRHDTSANWTSVNPVLLEGEVGIETDTGKQKFGDGTTAWNSLAYSNGDKDEIFVATYGTTTYSEITNALANYKTVVCKDGNRLYYYIRAVGGYSFGSSFGVNAECIFVNSNNIWSRGLIFLANRDLSNVLSIDSGSAVATALDAKVNKSGDTMTGVLSIDTDDNNRRACRIDNISTTAERDIEFNATSASHRVGAIRGALSSDGTTCLMTFGCCNPNNDALSGLQINRTNTSISCTFPNTTCVDGQWVSRWASVFSGVGAIGANSYSISSYLPNDGHAYEVLACMLMNDDGATSGTDSVAAVGNVANPVDNNCFRIYGNSDKGIWKPRFHGILVFKGNQRTVYYQIKERALHTGLTLYFYGYRRIGTNS